MIKNHGYTIARHMRTRSKVCALGVFALAAIAPLVPVAGAQESAHAKELGQKLMCVCGCNQILGSCNHVGCTYSHDMMKELEERIARNEPDDLTLQAFVQEYGPTVLSAPPRRDSTGLRGLLRLCFPGIAWASLWEVVRRWNVRAPPCDGAGSRLFRRTCLRALTRNPIRIDES